MEKWQFTTLAWLRLSDSEAKMAFGWYGGPGWYYNTIDAGGKIGGVKFAAEAEQAHQGQLDALNKCGAEGWCVAAFIPAATEGVMTKLVEEIVRVKPSGPHFILQQRVGT
jgi:hypothetical protein